jgi:hypothetical protein
METRTITQCLLHFLVMNPITDRTESGNIVAVSTSREKLISLYHDEQVNPYICEEWGRNYTKNFRKGGILEGFNPLSFFERDAYGHGICTEWINEDRLSEIKSRYFFID